jgi:inosine-uridine nucleoside N-ribohydrolase
VINIFIDTDNACGSHAGDIDDAFAIAALMAAPVPVIGACSVFGNTSADRSLENTRALVRLFDRDIPLIPGSAGRGDAPQRLASFIGEQKQPLRYAALGPLTNLAFLLGSMQKKVAATLKEIVLVGANSRSRGILPPLWPHEFNLTKDRAATASIFHSDLPLTICPLDVVRRLEFHPQDFRLFPEPLRSWFSARSRRWIVRNQLLKGRRRFPVWDLVATMYLIEPSLFRVTPTNAALSRLGKMSFGQGERPLRLVSGFDPQQVKSRYFQILSDFFNNPQARRSGIGT